MTDLLNAFEIKVPNTDQLKPKLEPVPWFLLNVPKHFHKEPLYHDPDYIEFCKSERFAKGDIDKLIIILQKYGGYADLILAADHYVMIKKKQRLMPLLARKISREEINIIVDGMFTEEQRSYAFSPGKQLDESYEVYEDKVELPFRNRVNVCSFQSRMGRALKITLRDLPAIPPSYDDLNVPQIIRDNAVTVEGLVAICGQTGSGKTTLCASILRAIKEDPHNSRVTLTYEKPIEFQFDVLPGYNPIFPHTIGEFGDFKTFHEGLTNALRCTPEVIFLGESRERETFETLPKIAESGHLGITTLHARSIANIFTRIGNEVDPSQMYGIIRQTLQYMHLAVYQWLAPTVDGEVMPLQEILLFTNEVKEEILSLPNEKLIAGIDKAVQKHGQCFHSQVEKAYREKRISKQTYRNAILSSGEKE
ncbi:ATPase, T2SS/T4P/T4SS family [Vibrio sp. 10N.261.46.E12]|uniref:ATPase, T2SS/T4P/T4SS family n=1 Tax=unclassified Vibrio TaxID=2614977 RepID=UPI0009785752|nr:MULTISPECIES: ATPase, T2SS/T4P/T4SS family [unclassified Vibrio]OMO34479.1 hypothetical protein BH584_12690 [Vibrio sp. 10N.261.45.E1]PMJ26198.1 hypothetical protein BCU27_09595 [Vibrio sp. 10N.286.45.B6]PML82808.1 hypothetical protein BCT66_20170 [Vibrio sp. 10N.261.49.E11]PMM90332.1 hypothetical protein BCT46_23595 [Vibrio sp. 10N.261.46.E8]PMN43952.1 hypothetical protein BCT32_00875 [Vibrio sp. 10N.261.45.E11]